MTADPLHDLKMVAMVLGTNTVRKELSLPEAECLAADPRFSLADPIVTAPGLASSKIEMFA